MGASKYYTRLPNGGVDRTAEPHASTADSFYDLLNLRPVVGALQQTPPIVDKQSLTTLASESSSQVRYIDLARTNAATLRYLVLNEQTARYINPTSLGTQTLIPTILQTKVPNNTTITGQCLLYGFNSTDFSALNDYIEVKIVSTTQFQWNRNGGAFSASVSIAHNVAIGANGLKVDFLDIVSAFTVNDLWRWTRTETLPYSSGIPSTKNFAYSAAPYLTDVYFGGIGRNVMRVRDGFITGVGYKRVYGKHVAIFQNHLVISHFAEGVYNGVSGVVDGYDSTTTPFKLGWSDLNNPDCLWATSTNEADTYSMPYNTYPESINYGITGLGLLDKTLWIYTTDGISSMDYVGLPNVMQILPKFVVGSLYHNGLIVTKNGHYFIGRNNIYFFDGIRPREIGNPVYQQLYAEIVPLDPTSDNSESVIGYYDQFRQEVTWTYWTVAGQCKQLVYMEKFDRWYFRQMPYETANTIRCVNRIYNSGSRSLYGGVQKILFDYDTTENLSSIVKDDLASSGYTQPYIITNDLFYTDLFFVKEASSFFIDAGWSSGVTGLQLSYSNRNYVSTAVAFTALAGLWTPAIVEGKLSLPRTSGSIWRFKFLFTGTKPVSCVLNAWGDVIEVKLKNNR